MQLYFTKNYIREKNLDLVGICSTHTKYLKNVTKNKIKKQLVGYLKIFD